MRTRKTAAYRAGYRLGRTDAGENRRRSHDENRTTFAGLADVDSTGGFADFDLGYVDGHDDVLSRHPVAASGDAELRELLP